MLLKIITPQKNHLSIHSALDFERALNIRFLSHVQIDNREVKNQVEKRHRLALTKNWITPRQKWLGEYYAEKMRTPADLDLTIAWIDEVVGYGVWTNQPIPLHGYIGEYTGFLRKRSWWGRWENLYCFDYTIGRGKRTPFVIDCQLGGNYTRFINHSFHPNLELASVYCDGMIRVIFFAKQAIPAGTQLCYDYGEEYWRKRTKPMNLSN